MIDGIVSLPLGSNSQKRLLVFCVVPFHYCSRRRPCQSAVLLGTALANPAADICFAIVYGSVFVTMCLQER